MGKAIQKHVVVAGATGLIGHELIRQLHERPEASFTALVRKASQLGNLSDRVREVIFDFEDPASYARLGTEIPCDVLLCALGTTMQKAGTKEAFRKVDLEIPRALIQRAAELEPKPVFGLVSAAGAGHPKGFYLQVKAEAEKALLDSGLPYAIVRPSLLMGEREEFRLGEKLALMFLAKPFLALARTFAPHSKVVWKYAPIEATKVAEALIRVCVDEPPYQQGRLLSGLELHHPILDI